MNLKREKSYFGYNSTAYLKIKQKFNGKSLMRKKNTH